MILVRKIACGIYEIGECYECEYGIVIAKLNCVST